MGLMVLGLTSFSQTARTRATLQGWFETGDIPTQSQYYDFIESAFNVTDGDTIVTANIGYQSVTAIKLNNDIISGLTALASGLVSTDELLISNAETIKRMDVSVIQTYMQNNLSFSSADSAWNSITLGNDAENANGTINFIASNGDAGNVAISASDQLTFNSFGGGYIFDGNLQDSGNIHFCVGSGCFIRFVE